MDIRVGQGFDIHRLEAGRPCIIGGVRISSDVGPVGHSDADPLLHAIIDALLGAAGKGDIGEYFPNDDPKWKDADSASLLRHVIELVLEEGWMIGNIDSTVVAETPKLAPVKRDIEERIAYLLSITPPQVNVKAKTHEGLDAIGDKQAIAAQVSLLLIRDIAS